MTTQKINALNCYSSDFLYLTFSDLPVTITSNLSQVNSIFIDKVLINILINDIKVFSIEINGAEVTCSVPQIKASRLSKIKNIILEGIGEKVYNALSDDNKAIQNPLLRTVFLSLSPDNFSITKGETMKLSAWQLGKDTLFKHLSDTEKLLQNANLSYPLQFDNFIAWLEKPDFGYIRYSNVTVKK